MILRCSIVSILAVGLAYPDVKQSGNPPSPLDDCQIDKIVFETAPAQPAPDDGTPRQDSPESAALSYLGYLAEDLDPPESLRATSPLVEQGSAFVTKERRDEIDSELQRLKWILSGKLAVLAGSRTSPVVSLLNTDRQGDLAVVSFQSWNRDFPLAIIGSTLAMVNKDGKWQSAPLTGSFDNTGLPLNGDTRMRAQKLADDCNARLPKQLHDNREKLLQEYLAEIERSFFKNRKKTKEILVRELLDSIKTNNLIGILASTKARDSEPIPAQFREELLAWLDETGRQDSGTWRRKFETPPLVNLAGDISSVIVPLGNSEIPDKAPEKSNPSITIHHIKTNSGENHELNTEAVTAPPAPADDQQEQPDKKEQALSATKTTLGVIAINRIPSYKWRIDGKELPLIAFPLEFREPVDPDKDPRWIRMNAGLTHPTPDMLKNQQQLLTEIMHRFHSHYPPLEWDTADEAVKSVLSLACKGDLTNLLQYIPPSFMKQESPDAFVTAVNFLSKLILSAQQPFDKKYSSKSYRLYHLFIMNSSVRYMVRPDNPMPQYARLYHKPGGNQVYVLASFGTQSRIPSNPDICFIIARQENGKWNLLINSDPLPLLKDRITGAQMTVLKGITDKGDISTVNDHDPFFAACKNHFRRQYHTERMKNQ